MAVYYLGRGDNRANIVPFPPGFQMLSGVSYARSYDNTTITFGNSSVAPRPIADRVSFNCLDTGPSMPEQPYMFRTQCANGLRAQIQFQSCWDGVNLYKSDNSHVAYMSQIDNGVCPPDHPVQLIHLFYEVLYGVAQIDQTDGGRFMFSQGDPTGYGFHGDFINGWDMDVLTPALTQCSNNDAANGQISQCPPLAAVDDSSEFSYNCPEYPPVVNETVHGIIGAALPGCINIVNGPGASTPADANNCSTSYNPPALNVYAAQSPIKRTSFTAGQAAGAAGWQYADCYTDNLNQTRTLSAASNTSNLQNIEACQLWCAKGNYRYAGVEFGKVSHSPYIGRYFDSQ